MHSKPQIAPFLPRNQSIWKTMFIVTTGQQTYSSEFCCKSWREIAFSIAFSSLSSCQKQHLMKPNLCWLGNRHKLSPTFTAGTSKPEAITVNTEKPTYQDKNNTFIRKGTVLWQCILPVMEQSKKVAHKYTNSSADHIFVQQFRFLRRALQYLQQNKGMKCTDMSRHRIKKCYDTETNYNRSFLTLGQLLLDRHKLSKF